MKHEDISKEAAVSMDIADATTRPKPANSPKPLGFFKAVFRYTFISLVALIVLPGATMKMIFRKKR